MKKIEIKIAYLGEVSIETGKCANNQHKAAWERVPVRPVDPTRGCVEVSDDRIETITVSWGDRVARGDTPAIYGTLTDGRRWELSSRDALRIGTRDLYDVEDAPLLAAVREARAQVAALWLADIVARPDVADVVEHYRSAVLDSLDREYAAHRAQWEIDKVAIARKFRRKWVQVGEQTVPGKHCVRSSRGTLLGYANCWNGKWLGTVEVI